MNYHITNAGAFGLGPADHQSGRFGVGQNANDMVDEVTVTLASAHDRDDLIGVLDGLSQQTAFDFVEVRPAAQGVAERWHARFRLSARNGVVGDTQIFALLRFLTGDVRWLDVSKRPAVPPGTDPRANVKGGDHAGAG